MASIFHFLDFRQLPATDRDLQGTYMELVPISITVSVTIGLGVDLYTLSEIPDLGSLAGVDPMQITARTFAQSMQDNLSGLDQKQDDWPPWPLFPHSYPGTQGLITPRQEDESKEMPEVFLYKCRTEPAYTIHLHPGFLRTENEIRWEPQTH